MKTVLKILTLLVCFVILLNTAIFADNTNFLFDDVRADSWYFPAVNYVYKEQIMVGISDTNFNPIGKITREQLVQVFFAIERLNKSDFIGETGFNDAPEGKWYSPAVKWAGESGISHGIGNGAFGVGRYVTREEFAVFMMNYTEYKHNKAIVNEHISGFSDRSAISSWAVEGMNYCVERNIINGKGNNTLDPKGNATRAEAAQMLKVYNTLSPFEQIYGNAQTLYVSGECNGYTITNAEGEQLVFYKGDITGDMSVYKVNILLDLAYDMEYIVKPSEKFDISCNDGCCNIEIG